MGVVPLVEGCTLLLTLLGGFSGLVPWAHVYTEDHLLCTQMSVTAL